MRVAWFWAALSAAGLGARLDMAVGRRTEPEGVVEVRQEIERRPGFRDTKTMVVRGALILAIGIDRPFNGWWLG